MSLKKFIASLTRTRGDQLYGVRTDLGMLVNVQIMLGFAQDPDNSGLLYYACLGYRSHGSRPEFRAGDEMKVASLTPLCDRDNSSRSHYLHNHLSSPRLSPITLGKNLPSPVSSF